MCSKVHICVVMYTHKSTHITQVQAQAEAVGRADENTFIRGGVVLTCSDHRQRQLADGDAGQGRARGGGGKMGGGEGGRGKTGGRDEDAGQVRATGGGGKGGEEGEGGRGADSMEMMTNFVDIVVLNADTAVGRPLQVTQQLVDR
jgi:hypothetical protein